MVKVTVLFLTESEDPVGKDDIDMVCDEIGEDWRQLCRKLGFSDGQAEQFSLDYSTSGIYEVMYQVGLLYLKTVSGV